MRNDLGREIDKAARAMSDLNTFAVVVSTLECGHLLCSSSQKAAQRIVSICKAEQQKRLREYDTAVAKAGGGTYG